MIEVDITPNKETGFLTIVVRNLRTKKTLTDTTLTNDHLSLSKDFLLRRKVWQMREESTT